MQYHKPQSPPPTGTVRDQTWASSLMTMYIDSARHNKFLFPLNFFLFYRLAIKLSVRVKEGFVPLKVWFFGGIAQKLTANRVCHSSPFKITCTCIPDVYYMYLQSIANSWPCRGSLEVSFLFISISISWKDNKTHCPTSSC